MTPFLLDDLEDATLDAVLSYGAKSKSRVLSQNS